MLLDVKESLKYQTKCPRCKVNWRIISKFFYENPRQAVKLTNNCPVCRARFERERREAKNG